MKKSLLVVVCVLMVLALVAGCAAPADGPQESASAQTEASEGASASGGGEAAGGTKKIANIVAEYNEWNQLKMDEMKKLADEYGWTIETFDAAQDVNQQINMVNSAVAQGFDFITIQPVDNAALNPSLEKAADAGVVVVNAYGQGEDDPLKDKIYQVNFDQKGAGILEAETYVDMVGEKGKVALIGGLTGADNARLRSEGMREVLEKYPDIEIVQEVFCDWDRQKAMAAAQDIITANPDLTAFLVQDDSMAWGVYEAIAAANKQDQIKIASQGFYESSIPAIKEGKFLFTISYPPAFFGQGDMKVFKDIADGKTPDRINIVSQELVTKENVDTAPF